PSANNRITCEEYGNHEWDSYPVWPPERSSHQSALVHRRPGPTEKRSRPHHRRRCPAAGGPPAADRANVRRAGNPGPLRATVEKQLTANEKMLWVGRPSRNRQVHPRNPMPPSVGIGMLVLAGVILVAVLGSAVIALKLSPLHVFGCLAAG